MRKEIWIMLGIAAIVIVAGVFLSRGGSSNNPQAGAPVDNSKLIRSSSHMTGTNGAKVTLVEFGDYECPACGAAFPIVKQVTDQYKDNPDFNFVFRNFPLPMHANAPMAAEAAEAAGAQGKYFEMHDMLYENQNLWGPMPNPLDTFVSYAQALGLDTNRFKSEVQSSKYQDIIQADMDDGNSLGINATPTFYLNGVQSVGLANADDFKKSISDALAK